MRPRRPWCDCPLVHTSPRPCKVLADVATPLPTLTWNQQGSPAQDSGSGRAAVCCTARVRGSAAFAWAGRDKGAARTAGRRARAEAACCRYDSTAAGGGPTCRGVFQKSGTVRFTCCFRLGGDPGRERRRRPPSGAGAVAVAGRELRAIRPVAVRAERPRDERLRPRRGPGRSRCRCGRHARGAGGCHRPGN